MIISLMKRRRPFSAVPHRQYIKNITMSYRVCVDVGGTFTDCVVSSPTGEFEIFKSSTTVGNFAQGVLDVLGVASQYFGYDLQTFFSHIDIIVHGTTVSTNALIEGKTGRVGLICNEGHPDVLTLREAQPKRTFEWKLDYPDPFVSRHLTVEVAGRITADGSEYESLSESDIRNAITRFKAMNVEAIAVCLLWSMVNPKHELRVREIVRKQWSDIPVTLSHELNPILREYRRMISTAIDASLRPIVSEYVINLEESLRSSGYTNQILLANCIGGMTPPAEIIEKPIYSVMSGPTLAPIAAMELTSQPDVLVIDMGGTTFDVSAIRDGRLVVSREAVFGDDHLGIPKIDVRSVGAGGGSIAWVDAGGLLKVGPQSAGSMPGPACYGYGGIEPTVTDANVVLGVIDPDYFLGGKIQLDRQASDSVISRIGEELGISPLAAAHSIITTCNHSMIAAIEDITVNEGINPRDSYLVSGGGATGCHAGEIAQELGIRKYMIPKLSSGLSAYGGLVSPLMWEETSTMHTDANRFDVSKVSLLLRELKDRGEQFLIRSGVPEDLRVYEYIFFGRYQYQSWEIEVPFDCSNGELSGDDVDLLVAKFHESHERIYSIRNENDLVEFTTWKVRSIGRQPEQEIISSIGSEKDNREAEPEQKGARSVFIKSNGGLLEVPVYHGSKLGRITRYKGPSIIEEETTTILLPPSSSATTDGGGNYLIELD